jgi:ATP-dependent RNA helicase DeaD
MTETFQELNLSPEILRALLDLKFHTPTPIQMKAIPIILDNKDFIGKAKTGTGKTAGFAIPVLQKMDLKTRGTKVLVICPTRELVTQVVEDFRGLAKYLPEVEIVPIFGGSDYTKQLRDLKRGPQVIVGTPGRLLDHLGRGTIKTDLMETVILDEADRMLDMGFREDMESILSKLPEKRQTIMFSATMSDIMIRLMKEHQNHPVMVEIESKKEEKANIEQFYVLVSERDKMAAFTQIVDFLDVDYGLIFCNTKVRVEEVVTELRNQGLSTEALHGDYSQNQREKVLRNFKEKKTKFLIATDVAGRGIDVNDLNFVFNFDFPQDTEDYIHRVGRTGRAGKKGQAFSFMSPKQTHKLKRVEMQNKVTISKFQIPSLEDAKAKKEVDLKNILLEKLKTRKPKTHEILYLDDFEEFTDEELVNGLYELWLETKLKAKPIYAIPELKEDRGFNRSRGGSRDRDSSRRNGSSGGRGEERKDYSNSRAPYARSSKGPRNK